MDYTDRCMMFFVTIMSVTVFVLIALVTKESTSLQDSLDEFCYSAGLNEATDWKSTTLHGMSPLFSVECDGDAIFKNVTKHTVCNTYDKWGECDESVTVWRVLKNE